MQISCVNPFNHCVYNFINPILWVFHHCCTNTSQKFHIAFTSNISVNSISLKFLSFGLGHHPVQSAIWIHNITKHLSEISFHKILKVWTVHFFILFTYNNTILAANCHHEMWHPPTTSNLIAFCHTACCHSFIFFLHSLILGTLAWSLGLNLRTKFFPSR